MATNRKSRVARPVGENRSGRARSGSSRGAYQREFDSEFEREGNGGQYEEYQGGRGGRRNVVRRVGSEVRSKVGGMDLDKALVLLHTALALAIVIKQARSRGQGQPRKAEPFRSAMSVLNYYLNEGRELSEMQRATLEDIKEELRMLYNREDEEMMSPAR